jgi:hypothetical protein
VNGVELRRELGDLAHHADQDAGAVFHRASHLHPAHVLGDGIVVRLHLNGRQETAESVPDPDGSGVDSVPRLESTKQVHCSARATAPVRQAARQALVAIRRLN